MMGPSGPAGAPSTPASAGAAATPAAGTAAAGVAIADDVNKGIIPRVMEDLFERAMAAGEQRG